MLSYKDCRDFCDFNEDEITAIAEIEHLPRMLAVAYAEDVIQTDYGVPLLKRIILDDIAAAQRRYDHKRARQLHRVLEEFTLAHPEREPLGTPGARRSVV